MRYTLETYKEYLQNLLPESNFTLDMFSGTEKPCEITCNNCQRHYFFAYAGLIARRARRNCKNVCRYCENNNWTARQNQAKDKALWLLKNKPSITLKSEIKTWASREPALWHCSNCNHDFISSLAIMFNKNNLECPWCETHPQEYSLDMILEKSQELWGNEYSVLKINPEVNTSGSKRITIEHQKCGFKYSVNLYNFLHGQGCPKCRASHGERKVRTYLQNHKFFFQEQKIVEINGHKLKLDFYLEEQGKKFAIEYNGIQHYQPVSLFNGQKGFNSQCYRDNLKQQYCKENDIELIIIPYNDESLITTEELAQRLHG